MADDAPDKNDFTEHYNTELDPASESSFQDWMKGQSASTGRDVGNDLYDYDMRGYWQQHLHDNADEPPQLSGGHLTDEFKKPNHPTFSTGSKYHDMAGNEGGTWEMIPGGEPGVEAWSFKPGATNLEHHEPGRLKSYFDKVEPGNQLILPEAPAAQPNYLANQRARFGEEMQNNPRSRSRLRAILSLENEGAGPGVVESLMNRMAMTGGTLERGMGGGANSFYGPVRHGLVEPRMREIERNPAWQARLDRSIDQALGGSNVIKGHTDQGSRGDPNYYTGGTGVNINGERFNHWGGHKGVEFSRQWTENQQRMVEAGGGAEFAANPKGDREGDSRTQQLDQSEKNVRENPQMSPNYDFLRKGIVIPTGELSSAAKPSRNIQHRGVEPTFVEQLQDAIGDQFKADTNPKGELSDELGIEDVAKRVHEAMLRTYGRARLATIESERRWAEWLKQIPKDER